MTELTDKIRSVGPVPNRRRPLEGRERMAREILKSFCDKGYDRDPYTMEGGEKEKNRVSLPKSVAFPSVTESEVVLVVIEGEKEKDSDIMKTVSETTGP